MSKLKNDYSHPPPPPDWLSIWPDCLFDWTVYFTGQSIWPDCLSDCLSILTNSTKHQMSVTHWQAGVVLGKISHPKSERSWDSIDLWEKLYFEWKSNITPCSVSYHKFCIFLSKYLQLPFTIIVAALLQPPTVSFDFTKMQAARPTNHSKL